MFTTRARLSLGSGPSRMRRGFGTAGTLLVLALLAAAANASTNVTADITSDTVWDLTGSPYILGGEIFVRNGATLTVNRGGTMLDRAKQQYLALLLNLASGKLLTSSVVTADQGTASQVIQYIADLINDGAASNDEIAKNMADVINNAQIVAAGVVPLDEYQTIHYRMQTGGQLELQVRPTAGGHVFAFRIPVPGPARIEVYDIRGCRVATPLAETLVLRPQEVLWQPGVAGGAPIPSGIYFARLSAPGIEKTVKFLHVGR